ncbi:unnamed protein product, partial [Phaeothamnion confervicola]
LRDYFRPSNFNWFLGGVPYASNLAARASRKGMLSELLASLYHATPTRLGGGKAQWRGAVEALVRNKGRLKVSTAHLHTRSMAGFYKILRKFFLDSGVLAATD